MYQVRRNYWNAASNRWARAQAGAVRPWLLAGGSLTRRLQRACPGRLSVRVIRQRLELPWPDEQRALKLRTGVRCLVREVLLECGGVPWVYARSLIPPQTQQGPTRRLARLGTRPLGAVLFTFRGLRRDPPQIARLSGADARVARSGVRGVVHGRRAVYRVSGRPLMVSEYFLPALAACGSRP